MKNIILFIAVSIFLQCSTATTKVSQTGQNKKNVNFDAGINESTIKNDWSSYSYGLYYKEMAVNAVTASQRKEYLSKAIENFNAAATYQKSLDRIYYQLSECYFYNYEYDKSIEYAQKSISLNKNNVMPYNRIYRIYVKLKDYNKAAEIFEEYMKVNPDNIHVQYILAEHYYKKVKDIDKAESAFNKVIEISKRMPFEDYYKEYALYYLGYIAFKKDNIDKAISFFNEVYAINRNNQNALYLLAFLYMEKYQLDEAEKYSKLFLAKNPKNAKMHSILGRIYYLKNKSSAISHFRESKDLKSVDGLLSWGLYHELLGDDENAEKYLRTVMRYNPKIISIHVALAKIHMRKKDKNAAFNEFLTAGILMYRNKLYEGAKYCFSEAIKLNNEIPGIYYYLGRVYEELNSTSLAIINYKDANKLKSDSDMMLHIGYLYGIRKDYDQSFKYFDMALERDPNNSKPYFFKGLISLWKQDYPGAETNIKKAITLDDKSETYYFYLAIVMEKLNKLNEAIESLEKAIQYNPKSARAYNYLGYLYADNNIKIDKSVDLIQKALEIDPGNGAYTDSLGWAYYRKGSYKLALEKLLNAEKILEDMKTPDPVVYDHIGDTYKELGKLKDAIYYWKKSIKIKEDIKIMNKIKEQEKKGDGNN